MARSKKLCLAEDGAVLIERFLDSRQIAQCKAAFNRCVANPSPDSAQSALGKDQWVYNDNANPAASKSLAKLVSAVPFGELLSDLWGSQKVWYFAEEVFFKRGNHGSRTVWHQDSAYLPWSGNHLATVWMSFETVPLPNALEVIKGSHRGIQYDGASFANPEDPTDPLHGGDILPRLPDIEAGRKANPDAYEILSWATNPGDVLILHPASLHGGAAVDARFRERRTLVLRFFGDDATFRSLPSPSASGFTPAGALFVDEIGMLKDGDPFRAHCFQQVH